MQAHAHRSRLQIENLRNVIRRKLFHIVEHEHNAKLGGDAKNRLME